MKSQRLDLEIPRHFTEHSTFKRLNRINFIVCNSIQREDNSSDTCVQGLTTTLLSNMNADLPTVTVQQVITATDSPHIITRLWSTAQSQSSTAIQLCEISRTENLIGTVNTVKYLGPALRTTIEQGALDCWVKVSHHN